jgi:diaminopimelate epimerase
MEAGRASGMVEVESRGGVLRVEWARGEEIFMTGPATYVFAGDWVLDIFNTETQRRRDF